MAQPKKTKTEVQIRWMIRRDMPEVLEIERQSFEFAWTEEDFLCCLRQRNCIGMVAECSEQVVGFMLYELLKSQLHILNFAVSRDFHRCGVGRAMVAKLINKLSQQRRQELVLHTRESNLFAQLFFKSQGFTACGVIRKYYEDTDEDAYRMRYRIGQEEVPASFMPRNRISGLFKDDE